MSAVLVRVAAPEEARAHREALAGLLVDAVDHGASVNFLRPLEPERAAAFWDGALPEIEAGRTRLVLAERGGEVVGCVLLIFARQPNQPHRADIGKMLVLHSARRLGIGRALLDCAEAEARAAGRTLLTLDTEEGSAGDALYRACGWTSIGAIPGYALDPDGVPAAASFFYKRVG